MPAGAVEREHLLAAQALAQRVFGDQRRELAREPGVLAAVEVGLHAVLDRCGAQLLQAPDLRLQRRFVAKVGERRAAPKRCVPLALEPLRVKLAGLDDQPVPARDGLETAGRRAERSPQPRHLDVECLAGGRGRVVAPQRLREDIGGDRFVRPDQQRGEQHPRARPAEVHRTPVVQDLQRPQDAELEHRLAASLSASDAQVLLAERRRGDRAALQRRSHRNMFGCSCADSPPALAVRMTPRKTRRGSPRRLRP